MKLFLFCDNLIIKEKIKMNNLYLIYVIDNMIEDVEDSKLDLMLMCL